MSAESEYCTLISSDNFTFTILRSAACVSGTLKSLLSSNFSESATGVVRLESIEGVLLEKVCEYLYYYLRYRDEKDVPDFYIEPELALNLLVAADFLDGKDKLKTS
ncbi:putative Transcriptional elongation regulator [Taphrina deformans PYCC 5710]|uniref:Elongin-C n=1 Tax=Taphrina deformans (strain PYCC 5710 / ATCC 11124 / CBS 356.35 / IMI 108563 / JCM 9778 / NBRC 8474) TaxID=1097556 RepID=R4X815_TAPDE|nr:putative Transcriptional elongation regulator [Taphrina deformans PYCC 5710]|eukprot:CCG81589.1 putative Transcriptional elongation regulator [Taphrina deformans PYCC 5710]